MNDVIPAQFKLLSVLSIKWYHPIHSSDCVPVSDADECTAPAVCDVINGDCTNTLGSYFCSCKVGFTGDGRTCTGKMNTNTVLQK